jgi:hypothetical protein
LIRVCTPYVADWRYSVESRLVGRSLLEKRSKEYHGNSRKGPPPVASAAGG